MVHIVKAVEEDVANRVKNSLEASGLASDPRELFRLRISRFDITTSVEAALIRDISPQVT
jgi:hypothetical protein